jgi:hypothetical protein
MLTWCDVHHGLVAPRRLGAASVNGAAGVSTKAKMKRPPTISRKKQEKKFLGEITKKR